MFQTGYGNWSSKVLETDLLYLSQQLLPYAPTRGLRPSSSKLLQVPRPNLRSGSCSFRASAPIWNSLPHSHSVHFCESLTTFRKHLRTLYFQLAFSATPYRPTTQRLRFNFLLLTFYKSTYLLTYLFWYLMVGVQCCFCR